MCFTINQNIWIQWSYQSWIEQTNIQLIWNGCFDPFECAGVNFNLIKQIWRSHMIHFILLSFFTFVSAFFVTIHSHIVWPIRVWQFLFVICWNVTIWNTFLFGQQSPQIMAIHFTRNQSEMHFSAAFIFKYWNMKTCSNCTFGRCCTMFCDAVWTCSHFTFYDAQFFRPFHRIELQCFPQLYTIFEQFLLWRCIAACCCIFVCCLFILFISITHNRTAGV